jgi:hypothetical protein
MRALKNVLPVLFLLLGLSATAQQYMPTLEEFGKNRVQYKRFTWKLLTTTNFEVYFYEDGQQAATLTAQFAESEFERITELLGHTPYSRTKIFLYSSLGDLQQSNIGITLNSERDSREESLSKGRIELAFSGNHIEFKRALVREVAQVYAYDMLYGGSLKDALQSQLLLSLPDWFMNGITAYIAEGWSVEMDDYLRDALLNKRLKKPNQLEGEEATLVGQSIWNFIAERYGRDNISNILNLTRIIRTEQTSVASTLGMKYERFLTEWREYYTSQANTVAAAYANPAGGEKWRVAEGFGLEKVHQVKLSPTQAFVAYSLTERGRFRVVALDTKTRQKTELLRGGDRFVTRNVQPAAPLLAWQADGSLAVIAEDKNRTLFYQFAPNEKGTDLKLKARRVIRGFNQIESFDVSADGTSLVLSADRKGQNDLFVYNLGRGSILQLTNDAYDDLDPAFTGRGLSPVVFVSNRLSDTLNVDKGTYKTIGERYGLFLHEGGARAVAVTRLIDSLGVIAQPVAANANTFYFLSDEKGIRNVYRLDVDSTARTVRQLTQFRQNIRSVDLVPTSGALAYVTLEDGAYTVGYLPRLDRGADLNPPATPRSQRQGGVVASRRANVAPPVTSAPVRADSTAPGTPPARRASGLVLRPGEVDTENYQFDVDGIRLTERRTERSNRPIVSSTSPRTIRRDGVRIKGPSTYRDIFVVNGNENTFLWDPIRQFGWLNTITLNDLLENNIIRGGIFITPSFRNSDLFAEYIHLPGRIDYGVRFDRRTIYIAENPLAPRNRYNKLTLTASYPVNEALRVSVSPSYTTTRRIDATGGLLPAANQTSDYLGGKAEIVFDNTQTNGANMLVGTRFKIRYQQNLGLRNRNESFNKISLDFRHYQKIHRDLVLATRLSFGRSGGASPKQYILGGMDNWLFNQPEQRSGEDPLAPSDYDSRELFFLDFVTPLRGFKQNKASGTNHILFNAELRMPLVKYLYRGPVASNFLRNLQLAAFSDIGTAWSGDSGPFTRQNSLNTEIIAPPGNAFRATVTNFKNPYLIGYGAGVRTIFLGYYTKFDVAWGMEDKTVRPPVFYVTLGYDF